MKANPFSPGARALGILLRTLHIGAMAVVLGGLAFGAASAELRPWGIATLLSGLGLLGTEARHSRHWIYQGSGLAALAHVLLAGLALLLPGQAFALAMGAVIVASAGSHMPKGFRKWSLRHRAVVD